MKWSLNYIITFKRNETNSDKQLTDVGGKCQMQDIERSKKLGDLTLFTRFDASCVRKMLSQFLMRAFLDQAAHVFDLKGQSQTRTYSMPNLDF